MTIQQMLLGGGDIPTITINLNDTQTATYDLFVAIGSPAYPIKVNLNVNAPCYAGITQGSGWVAGSTCVITNNAGIYGTGGNGGDGGDSWVSAFTSGAPGQNGGDAISLSIPTTINNLSEIYGGGGGGGGGGAASDYIPPTANRAGGGGGGGGRGYNFALGGYGGTTNLDAWFGQDGDFGNSTGGGAGGNGGVGFGNIGGKGGNGSNAWGNPGQSGGNGSGPNITSGGAGGAGGYAVRQNGNSLTWVNMGSISGSVG